MSENSTILIVDDDAAGRDMLAALLQNQGYQLAFAHNGTEALAQAALLNPDAILLDVMMPGMDGFEVCRQIRANPNLVDITIIMLTALDDRGSRLSSIEAGADDFISKPFDRIELRARLRAIARLNRSRRLMLERAKFERVVDLSPNGILIVGADATIRLANPAMLQMIGASPDAGLVGRSFHNLIAPHERDRAVQQLGAVYDDQARVVRFETVLVRGDGAHVPVEADVGHFVWDAAPAVQIIVRDIAERKQSDDRAQRQIEQLEALRAIDATITSSLDLSVTLNVILDQAVEHLRVDVAAMLLRKPYTQTLEYVAVRGLRKEALPRTDLHVGEGCAGYAALHRRRVSLPGDSANGLPLSPPFGAEFPIYYGVPLIIKGQVEGVLELLRRSPRDADAEWQYFLEAIAGQAAVAIEHAVLFDSLQRTNVELVRAYDTTLEGWARALELRDKETEGHAQRVTEMTVRLARRLGVQESELVHIRRGALLHDIGKMGIPDSILLKPGPLTDEEWAVMRLHPVWAYNLLLPVDYLRPALDIPYGHHERWDGSGYPRGLKAEQIPLAARIFAVVDVWDALRYDRPYRNGWPAERVREHIRSLSGVHFDPQVVEAFLKLDAAEASAANRAILVVDDDADIVDMLRRALSDMFTVLTASSGEGALDILAREKVTVILTDQRMPGLTGVQLLERARHIQPTALGIICSAYLDSQALSEALNLGTVRGFIHKPWTVAELRRRVSEVVSQQALQGDAGFAKVAG